MTQDNAQTRENPVQPRMRLDGLASHVEAREKHIGQARKTRKREAAGARAGNELLEAQRVARELGQHGPVTMDHVVTKLREAGKESHRATLETKRDWHGKVFAGGDWVRLDHVQSTRAERQGSAIALWALKSWLEKFPQNGESYTSSCFAIAKIYSEFTRHNPGVGPSDLEWLLGRQRLSAGIVASVNREMASHPSKVATLFGARVTWFDGVGALLQRRKV